jgi:hypothetical protein
MTAGRRWAALTAACRTKIHLAVCINSPAARLWLIEDVGMYEPTLLRTAEPGTTEVVAFLS